MHQLVNVSLILGIQLDVTHVEKVTDDCSTLESIIIATLCDDSADGVQAHVEHVWDSALSW